MTLLDIIKKIKIDLTQGYIETDSWSALNHDFEITPRDFLSYSKKDFKLGDKRGLINALTNAKRAIDCQTDKVFLSIGIDPNNFPKVVEEYITKSTNSPTKKDLPVRLKFLQAINFTPAEIIANVRQLRHKLEHYYQKPSKDEVSNAIELAELFILATDSKLKNTKDFSLTDKEKHSKSEKHLWDSVYFVYNSQKNYFEVTGFFGKKTKKKILLKNTDIEFYFVLKIATSFDYEEDAQDAMIDLIELIGHPIPRKNIMIEVD